MTQAGRNRASVAGIFVGIAGIVFAYAEYHYGGVTSAEWSVCLSALSGVCLLFWLLGESAKFAPALDSATFWTLLAAPAYVALQLAPLPLRALGAISPARVELATWGRVGTAPRVPVSVAPAMTFSHLLRVLAYILMFLLARELSWRLGRRRWLAVAPFAAVAILEACLCLAQGLGAAGGSAGPGRGTYVNSNHLAGLLEMALPFTIMICAWQVHKLRAQRGHESASLTQALFVCLPILASAVLFLGLVYSLSRMGLAAALSSFAVLAFLAARRTRHRFVWALFLPLAFGLLLVFVLPVQLLDRLHSPSVQAGEHTGLPDSAPPDGTPPDSTPPDATTPDGNADTRLEIAPDTRLQFWKETAHLIADYPWFGTGLGTYVSAIQKYRHSAPMSLLDYAHNDYLQLVAELGLVGFLPFLVMGMLFLRRLFRTARAESSPRYRYLAASCAASLTALALHEIVDFNLYIPANALFAAWIAGIAAALELTPDKLTRREAELNLSRI